MQKKYSEQLNRYAALDAEGKPREILERITFERGVDRNGRPRGKPVEINRRYDLKTGERLHRLGEREFQDDESGARLTLVS